MPTQVEQGESALRREEASLRRIEELGGKVFPQTLGSAVTLHHADTATADAVLGAADGVIDLDSLSLIDAPPSPGWVARFQGEPHLRYLALSEARLSSEDIASLRGLPSLEELHLIGVGITDGDLAAIVRNAPNLAELTLAYDPVTDAGAATLEGLSKLRTLRVVETRIGEQQLAKLVENNPWLTIVRGGLEQVIKGPWTGK